MRPGGTRSSRFLAGISLAIAALLAATTAALAAPPPHSPRRRASASPAATIGSRRSQTDSLGHVYVMWTHYVDFEGGGAGDPDPTCPDCGSPHMDLQISADNGATWSTPRAPWPTTTRQDDPQIVVDPADGQTIYASFMQDNHSSEYVSKSTDFGQTWQTVLVEPLRRGTDKDILAVRGDDVYLTYHTIQKAYVSVSHDAGATWDTHDMFGAPRSSACRSEAAGRSIRTVSPTSPGTA